MDRWLIYGISFLFGAAGFGGESLPDKVETFLQPRIQEVEHSPIDRNVIEEILARPDPGTFFLRYAYGISRKAGKLLTPEQAAELAGIIEKNSAIGNRWHDERNVLRCKFNQVMWRYVAAGEGEAKPLRDELSRWMELRMLWTRQEHLAQYRFAREVWQVLTPEQKQMLLGGEWKSHAKMDTGHTRGNFTGKVIRKALDEPDDAVAFEKELAAWSETRAPLHGKQAAAENEERCIVFAMDRNSEAMAADACLRATEAYANLYLAEADAMRRIIRSAYRNPGDRCSEAAEEAWHEAEKRFREGAGELIVILADGSLSGKQ